MSDLQRRRLRPNPVPRRAGEPNVLSNQATPNRLSSMGTTDSSIAPMTAGRAKAAMPQPAIRMGRPTAGRTASQPASQPADDRFERPRRQFRAPSLGVIIFVGIVLINAARFFGVGSDGVETPGPVPPSASAPRTPVPSTIYGAVSFGKSLGDKCALQSTAPSFSAGVDVFWRADLLQVQAADAAIVVVTFKGTQQIDYEYVPPDPAVGKWQVFCAGPARDELAGTYRLEIWNADRSKLLARGEFLRLGPSATPNGGASGGPSATSAPSATRAAAESPTGTFVVAVAGDVAFGTAISGDCTLSGIGDTFEQTDLVWWRAELNQPVPPGADVLLFAMLDGFVITNEPVPASALVDARSVVCAWAPTEGVATGYYVVQVWTTDRQIMLANGKFFRNP